MNKQTIFFFLILFLYFHCSTNQKQSFWLQQRKGANCFNEKISQEWFKDAYKQGITLVRLTPTKWKSKHKDFLIGNADQFTTLIQDDLSYLKRVLDWAHNYDIKVILTFLTLPGCRWIDHNNNQFDWRIYCDTKFHMQTADFWQQIAQELKNHPAIVGYNIINEPCPERTVSPEDYCTINFHKIYTEFYGTPADLNKLYQIVVDAIRAVDQETPIVLDSGLFATPWAITALQPLKEKNIIYSIHMYEPYQHTFKHCHTDCYTYPGAIPDEHGKKQNGTADFFPTRFTMAKTA